ncbi:hypothetical protein BP5796_13037 [Coleophoma crateriformis]|uniref:Methyltransferase n=1 Tax=Coleophoma crateriformis TaxID=565419 RepID=A0A3D8Q5M6_9HELO|nr:hypothetical protein BP5796_13037 [Coleophoma crateriformis]
MPHNTSLDTHTPVEAFIDYYQPNADGSPPDGMDLEIQYGQKAIDHHPVKMRDLRAGNFTLEKNGFQLVPHHSKVTDFNDKETVKRDYYPEVGETIRKYTGASKVYVLTHNTRSSAVPKMDLATQKIEHVGPMRRCHVDVAPGGVEAAVIKRIGEDFMKPLAGRWKIVNAWKPVKTVERDPLAVADLIPDEDLLAIQRFRADGSISEERYMVKAASPGKEEHSWYFAPEQRPDELLLFNQYSDKADRGIADRVAHAAFVLPGTEDKPTRESIEVRALVVY